MISNFEQSKFIQHVSDYFVFFQEFHKGFLKEELKKKGRADTRHNRPLENLSLERIQHLMVLTLKLMKSDKAHIDAKDVSPEFMDYFQLKEYLPEGYEQNWHTLLPYLSMWMISLLLGRRGREGLDQLKKSDFEKFHDEDTGVTVFMKVRGELTKNHRTTDQDLAKGGKIPYKVNEQGKN